jgi:hypothetical protein
MRNKQELMTSHHFPMTRLRKCISEWHTVVESGGWMHHAVAWAYGNKGLNSLSFFPSKFSNRNVLQNWPFSAGRPLCHKAWYWGSSAPPAKRAVDLSWWGKSASRWAHMHTETAVGWSPCFLRCYLGDRQQKIWKMAQATTKGWKTRATALSHPWI